MRVNIRGMTMLEMMLVVGLISLALFALINFFSPTANFFQGNSKRTQVDSDARSLMDTVVHILRDGKAGTVVISTPAPVGTRFGPPNSVIEFDTINNRHYKLYYDMNQPGRVKLDTTNLANSVVSTSPIADNVTAIIFAGDGRDPAVVNVSLRLDVPLDQSGRTDRVYTVILPNQEVHLVGTSNR